MPWYKGFEVVDKDEKITGYTLIDALEKVVKPPKRDTNKPFRMPVSGVYQIKGVGDVITGRIEQGKITAGVDVKFYPTGCKGKAFSLEMHHKKVEEATHGDNVGVNVKNLPKENMPRVGDIMCIDDLKSRSSTSSPSRKIHSISICSRSSRTIKNRCTRYKIWWI